MITGCCHICQDEYVDDQLQPDPSFHFLLIKKSGSLRMCNVSCIECTEVGWKMINLSVTDRAGQSGSRERGPDRKVKRSVRGS